MSNITLHTDSPATTTCVPNVFIDQYMVHASGEFSEDLSLSAPLYQRQ